MHDICIFIYVFLLYFLCYCTFPSRVKNYFLKMNKMVKWSLCTAHKFLCLVITNKTLLLKLGFIIDCSCGNILNLRKNIYSRKKNKLLIIQKMNVDNFYRTAI